MIPKGTAQIAMSIATPGFTPRALSRTAVSQSGCCCSVAKSILVSGNGAAQVYQLTSANAINKLADLSYSGSTVNFTAPAQSITLLVLGTDFLRKTPLLRLVLSLVAVAALIFFQNRIWNHSGPIAVPSC